MSLEPEERCVLVCMARPAASDLEGVRSTCANPWSSGVWRMQEHGMQ